MDSKTGDYKGLVKTLSSIRHQANTLSINLGQFAKDVGLILESSYGATTAGDKDGSFSERTVSVVVQRDGVGAGDGNVVDPGCSAMSGENPTDETQREEEEIRMNDVIRSSAAARLMRGEEFASPFFREDGPRLDLNGEEDKLNEEFPHLDWIKEIHYRVGSLENEISELKNELEVLRSAGEAGFQEGSQFFDTKTYRASSSGLHSQGQAGFKNVAKASRVTNDQPETQPKNIRTRKPGTPRGSRTIEFVEGGTI